MISTPYRTFSPPRLLIWLNVLSLDAPLVAVVWQDFFARTFSLKLDAAPRLVLALSIWLAYSADRLLDGWKIPHGNAVTARHRFAQEYRAPLAWIWGIVLCGTVALSWFWLPLRLFERGLFLVLSVAIYFLLNQLPKTSRPLGGLKEFAVGILFASGTVIFIAPRMNAAPVLFWWACAAWSLLAALNCYAISCWEIQADRTEKQESLVTRWPFLARRFKGAALIVTIFASAPFLFLTSLRSLRFGLAIASSSLGLALLDYGNGGMDSDLLRTAADLMLFTPLLFRFFS